MIGRVDKLDHRDPYLQNVLNVEDGKKRRASLAVEEVLNAKWVTLLPVFDFFNVTLRPVPVINEQTGKPQMSRFGVPDMAMQRDPILNAHEFYIEQRVPAHLNLANFLMVEFFSQMGERNAENYRNFMRQAIQQHEQFTRANSEIQPPTEEERRALERGHGRRS